MFDADIDGCCGNFRIRHHHKLIFALQWNVVCFSRCWLQRIFEQRKLFFQRSLGLVDIDITDDNNGLQVGAVPAFIKMFNFLIRKMLNDFFGTNWNALCIQGMIERDR